ncbi:MAG: DinB family protein [Planctomycetota bacterium]
MKDHLLGTYAHTLNIAKALTADVPCERFTELPFEAAKHPGWVLGHLSIASAMTAAHLREPTNPEPAFEHVPAEWMGPCMGETIATRDTYAKKDALLAALESAHADVVDRFAAAGDDVLALEFPKAEYRDFFPTLGACAVYMLGHHEGYHLGQLSQWRRAAGFGKPEGMP